MDIDKIKENRIKRLQEFIANVQAGIEHTEDAMNNESDPSLKKWFAEVIEQNIEIIKDYNILINKIKDE